MKRLFFSCLAATGIFLCLHSKAQTPDTANIKGFLRYLFQDVDKSQVPTGYLEEYGMPGAPMHTFNCNLNSGLQQ